MDCTMRRVSQNLANRSTTVQEQVGQQIHEQIEVMELK